MKEQEENIDTHFKVGNFEYDPNKKLGREDFGNWRFGSFRIDVLKRTKQMLYLNIHYYNGHLFDLEDVKITRKIYKDDNEEYIKTIYYTWNTPCNPSFEQSWRYDTLNIYATKLNSNPNIDED